VGKTRLATEARRRARAGGAWILAGRAASGVRLPLAAFAGVATSALGARGLDALVDIVRGDLHAHPPLEAENCAHLIALSIGRTVPGERVSRMEAAQLALETERAWALWLLTRAAGAPAFLCIEDLHDADDRTIALLSALPRRFEGSKFVVCATSRPGGALPPGYERIALRELPSEGAVRIAELVFGAPAEPPLARLIAEQSGGHPYYAEALARFLVESGLAGGSPARLLKTADRLPDGLAGLLVARLDRLQEATRDGLKAASVVGRSFWRRAVAAIAGRAPEAGIDEAERLDLVARDLASPLPADDACQFRHALLREAAYSLLPRKDRARLHALAADWLQALPGRAALALAAAQRSAAGDPERAAALWLSAGERAFAENAFPEAETWARESLAQRRTAEALVLLVRATRRTGRLEECERCAQEIVDMAGATPSQIAEVCLEASGVCGVRGPYDRGHAWATHVRSLAVPVEMRIRAICQGAQSLIQLRRMEECRAAILEAERLLETPGARTYDARIAYLDARAREAMTIEDFAAMEAAVHEALKLRQEARDTHGVATSMNNLGVLHYHRDELERSLSFYGNALALRREVGDRVGVAATLSNMAIVCSKLGRFEEGVGCHEEALAIRRDAGDIAGTAISLNGLANLRWYQGHVEKAIPIYEESLALRRSIGDDVGAALSLANLGACHDSLGRPAECVPFYAEAIRLHRVTANPEQEGIRSWILGMVYRKLERFPESLEAARRSVEIGRQPGRRGLLCEGLSSMSETLLHLGAVVESCAAAEEALAIARDFETGMLPGLAFAQLGRLADHDGREEEALEMHRKACACIVPDWTSDTAYRLHAEISVRLSRAGMAEEAAGVARSAIERARTARDGALEAMAHAAAALAAAVGGRPEECRACLEDAERVWPAAKRWPALATFHRQVGILIARALRDRTVAEAEARRWLGETGPTTSRLTVTFLEKVLRGEP
jgi:tetratricopeptide (TPR) repeat protein